MGISGLLPQLKSIQEPITLQRYSSQSLAIDGYAWLHRSAHSCAMELCMGLPTEKYIQFFVKKLNMLRNKYNINPYLVFDGDSLQVKSGTESKRREKREQNRIEALNFWAKGDKKKGIEFFQKSIDITPEMTKAVIDYCEKQGFNYIVAPYEADSQLVYLEKTGLVQGIISEDSDLLVFGCRRLLTKLNDYGECIEISRDDFHHLDKKFPLGLLSDSQIRSMVCLSGCDYTAGIPQVGLVTAMKLVRTHKEMDKILLKINRDGKWNVPRNFLKEFKFADFAFQYQRVYCPIRRKLVTLNEIPEQLHGNPELYECIGKAIHKDTGEKCVITDDNMINHEIHSRIANGELNPFDHRVSLVSRELSLKLASKPNFAISPNPTSAVKPISSYYRKAAVVPTVTAVVPTVTAVINHMPKLVAANVHEKESRLDRIIKKRKLAADVGIVTAKQNTSEMSSFFASKSNSTPASPPVGNENNTAEEDVSEVLEELPEVEEDPLRTPFFSATISTKNRTLPLGNTADSQLIISPLPEQTPLSPQRSNVLREAKVSPQPHILKENTTTDCRPSLIGRTILQSFMYRSGPELTTRPRIPLGKCDTNSKIPLPRKKNLTKLNKRMIGITSGENSNLKKQSDSHRQDTIIQPTAKHISLASARNVSNSSQNRAVSCHAVTGGTRQVSLSDFLYKG
ncbi:HCL289Cp [Eremothecium sinecaudum]|uniref:HCL289Cp n=1 Tax=Eremothecium sinecaudum TaxID=45286 RepID=A0A120K1Y3_9SACH|nr:HCL289Cp [Eremothecium sinecaudum]AMD19862.1 HCL289Cp [Eremothecium sinecaudum]